MNALILASERLFCSHDPDNIRSRPSRRSAALGSRPGSTYMALRSRLTACKDRIDRRQNSKPRFEPAFRLLWVLISKVVDGLEDLAQLMQPAVVKRWHTTDFRAYWRWKLRILRRTSEGDYRQMAPASEEGHLESSGRLLPQVGWSLGICRGMRRFLEAQITADPGILLDSPRITAPDLVRG